MEYDVVASVCSDDHLAVNFTVYFRVPQDVTRKTLQDIRNVLFNATRKDGTFGIFIFDRESIDIHMPGTVVYSNNQNYTMNRFKMVDVESPQIKCKIT